ncbi:hypothetical protein GUJ93_ZPchr0006g42673 [Zizania palustris]|uniref:Uncharacterized protein n=1 Tax=Zizania palustris TaxID=103762 RepID=A0A8J5VXE8_ZIZPA|nr:hypothetical protein GUJ93_ZPchr0006g42673 [Zizania palustris]
MSFSAGANERRWILLVVMSVVWHRCCEDGATFGEEAADLFLKSDYYFEGYWMEIVGRLDNNMTERYEAMERMLATP